MGDEDRVGVQARVRGRVGSGLAGSGLYDQQQCSGWLHGAPLPPGTGRPVATGGDLDFLDSVVEGLVVRDHVEELAGVDCSAKAAIRRRPISCG